MSNTPNVVTTLKIQRTTVQGRRVIQLPNDLGRFHEQKLNYKIPNEIVYKEGTMNKTLVC